MIEFGELVYSSALEVMLDVLAKGGSGLGCISIECRAVTSLRPTHAEHVQLWGEKALNGRVMRLVIIFVTVGVALALR